MRLVGEGLAVGFVADLTEKPGKLERLDRLLYDPVQAAEDKFRSILRESVRRVVYHIDN